MKFFYHAKKDIGPTKITRWTVIFASGVASLEEFLIFVFGIPEIDPLWYYVGSICIFGDYIPIPLSAFICEVVH